MLKGLSSSEAKKILNKNGENVLPENPPPGDIKILLSQLRNPLVYILVAAGIVTVFLNHLSDALIILFAVVVNTVLGFIQERRAGRALSAIKSLIHPTAKVIRGGKVKTIDSKYLVVGDIVILDQGVKVPADGVLVDATRLFLNEATLTGESYPLSKNKKDEVFMGTFVTAGKGIMKITKTAGGTQIGKIAERVQEKEEKTPLGKNIEFLGKQLTVLVFMLVVFVMAVGLLRGVNFADLFTTSVALAVSAIPEGLLVGLTVVLAVGMQRILSKKGLVRNLLSAETLGSVSVICVDKTGTLTEGEMKVSDFFGSKQEIAKQMIVANDMDDPLVIAAHDWALRVLVKKGSRQKFNQEIVFKNKRLDSLPFSSKERFFASLNETSEAKSVFYVNGAPEYLLSWCDISLKEKKEIESQIEIETKKGKRVVGLACKEMPSSYKKILKNDVKSDLSWVGFLTFSDPIREGVRKAFEKTKKAGIKTIVITGDYPGTAISVMNSVGFEVSKSEILHGEEVEELDVTELAEKIGAGVKLFVRTTPEQKYQIVKALKSSGQTVAMMGDGVNDAPALKASDIGIVVGNASDVSKEIADLVLLDSNYETIVSAIEEGRGIFANIRKIILYLLGDAFEEIIAVVGTILIGLPTPVTAGQILWINLISDGFPDLALTVDPKPAGIMNERPRNSSEHVLTNWMKILILTISFLGGIVSLLLFVYYYKTTGDLVLARSVCYMSLGVNSLVFVFSVRTLTMPFWKENLLKNPWLNLAVFMGLILQFLPIVFAPLGKFMGLKFPGSVPMVFVFLGTGITFVMIEAIKALFRNRISFFRH